MRLNSTRKTAAVEDLFPWKSDQPRLRADFAVDAIQERPSNFERVSPTNLAAACELD
jgi:hypothetical protein